MKLEIACEFGTIRLSDRRLSVGSDASLDDILENMVGALRSVAADEKVTLSKGDFGFQVQDHPEDTDEEE